jgi:hypothetical protein
MIGSILGYLGGLGLAGFFADSDTETGFPWYVDFLLTFLFALAGIVIAIAVLTKVGFLEIVTDFFKTYLAFIADIFKAIAEPLVKLFL